MTSPGRKAQRTAKWAHTMTKWAISYATGGKRPGFRTVKTWQIVAFPGGKGSESRGVVDFLAIRRDHKTDHGKIRSGDLLEIILVQVKGGTARDPTSADVARLKEVQRHHGARAVVLADWKKGQGVTFRILKRNSWVKTTESQVFGLEAHEHLDPAPNIRRRPRRP